MRPFILLPLAAAGLAAAQTINPNSVDQSTRDAWCNDQTSACPILCSQTTQSTNTESNTCSPVRGLADQDPQLTAAEHSRLDLRLQRRHCA
jgi:hypothetical protein